MGWVLVNLSFNSRVIVEKQRFSLGRKGDQCKVRPQKSCPQDTMKSKLLISVFFQTGLLCPHQATGYVEGSLLHSQTSFFLVVPHGMWDLNCPTRDWALVPCSESTVLTAGPPRKSLVLRTWWMAGVQLMCMNSSQRPLISFISPPLNPF